MGGITCVSPRIPRPKSLEFCCAKAGEQECPSSGTKKEEIAFFVP
jgi:hypothetical protein